MKKLLLLIIVVFSLTSCKEENKSSSAPGSSGYVDAETAKKSNVSEVTALDRFLEKSSKPAVIKFYAHWCSTCHDYEPHFQNVKDQLSNKVDFFEIDVDDKKYRDLLKQLRISRIPETVFVTKDRNNVTKKLGSLPEAKLTNLIKTNLLSDK